MTSNNTQTDLKDSQMVINTITNAAMTSPIDTFINPDMQVVLTSRLYSLYRTKV